MQYLPYQDMLIDCNGMWVCSVYRSGNFKFSVMGVLIYNTISAFVLCRAFGVFPL